MAKKLKTQQLDVDDLTSGLSHMGLEEAKINLKHAVKLDHYDGKPYDVIMVTIESGLLTTEINFDELKYSKYIELIMIKQAIEKDTVIDLKIHNQIPNIQIINEHGHFKYCITDGNNIKIFISKNLLTRLVNQMITMKIEHSKNNMVDFLEGSVESYDDNCFFESYEDNVIAIPDSSCVKEIETMLNLLYTKYGIKFDPTQHDISGLYEETQHKIIAVIAIIENKLIEHTRTKPIPKKHKHRDDEDDSEDDE